MNASIFLQQGQSGELPLNIDKILRKFRYGIHRSRIQGSGIDFRSLRPKVPSDPLSRIDRAASSRGPFHPILNPVVRTFYTEKEMSAVVIIDVGSSMQSLPAKIIHAAKIFWLFTFSALKYGDSVRLLLIDEQRKADSVWVRKKDALEEFLRCAIFSDEVFEESIYSHLAKLSLKDSLLVVISDFTNPFWAKIDDVARLDVYENNIRLLFLGLDEWWGFESIGYALQGFDVKTDKHRLMDDRDIKAAAALSENYFRQISSELQPFSSLCIRIPLLVEPLSLLQEELFRLGIE